MDRQPQNHQTYHCTTNVMSRNTIIGPQHILCTNPTSVRVITYVKVREESVPDSSVLPVYRLPHSYTNPTPSLVRVILQRLDEIPCTISHNNDLLSKHMVKLSSVMLENNRVSILVDLFGFRKSCHDVLVVADDALVIDRDKHECFLNGLQSSNNSESSITKECFFHDDAVLQEVRLRLALLIKNSLVKSYESEYLVFHTNNDLNTTNMVESIIKDLSPKSFIVQITAVNAIASQIDLLTYIFNSWVLHSLDTQSHDPILFLFPEFHLFKLYSIGARKSLFDDVLWGMCKIIQSNLFPSPRVIFVGISNTICSTQDLPSLTNITGKLQKIPQISAAKSLQFFYSELDYRGVKSEFNGDESKLLNLFASAVELNHLRISKIIDSLTLDSSSNTNQETKLKTIMQKLGYLLPAKIDLVKSSSPNLMVGGNNLAKMAIHDALLSDVDLLTHFGIDPPSKLLLYGPPGTGKTLLARYAANLTDASFISLCASEVVHSTYGSSEKVVRHVFKVAARHSPCIVFIDEFDGLFSQRSTSSSRLTSTLLSCLDELSLNKKHLMERNKQTIVLAASNTPWTIDKAFYSRFDRCIHVALPTSTELEDIFKTYLKKMKISIDSSIDEIIDHIIPKLTGFSGADISALCRAAAISCLMENGTGVNLQHFKEALSGFDPSSDPILVKRCKEWKHIIECFHPQ